jgi:3-phosphoshikimate 1-carboxyvinyltransferase
LSPPVSVLLTSHGSLSGELVPPPSKSYTHRTALLASLAEEGTSTIRNPLFSRDTVATFEACRAFGASIVNSADVPSDLEIVGAKPKTPSRVIDAENSGTTLRLMTSALALPSSGRSTITGDASLRRRPMQPLLDALGELGVRATSTGGNGCAPISVEAGGIKGGSATIAGEVSSQFVSSILISGLLAESDVSLVVTNAVSKPYIRATLDSASSFGARVESEGLHYFHIESGQRYRACNYVIPADFSSASFLAAAVAMVGGKIALLGLSSKLPQADSAIIDVLRVMGVGVHVESGGTVDGVMRVESDGKALTGGRFDLSDSPDLLPVLASMSLKCESPVEIVGCAHARNKETDRISTIAFELSKLGVKVEERRDGIIIHPLPRSPTRAVLDAHDDHRLFMAFCLISLLYPEGLPVLGAGSVDVSFPTFLEDMKKLGAVPTTKVLDHS